MLTIFYGNDEVDVRRRARAHTLSLVKNEEDLNLFEGESFNTSRFEELLFSQSLLDERLQIISCDHIFENEEALSFFEKNLELIAMSKNHCVISEGKLSKDFLKKAKELGVRTMELASSKKENRGFNTFVLGDALGMKDKKNLWVIFAEARSLGLDGEEIVGVLFWQLKNILLALNTKNFEEAGVSGYPYKKAKQFSKLWKENELQKALFELTEMYHNAHRGNGDFMNQLEIWILGIK